MMQLSDIQKCPSCGKMEVVRVLRVFGVCAECTNEASYDKDEELLLTVDGAKVYYRYQELLSHYQDCFEGGAFGGVVANSTLPPSLNQLARYLTLMYLCNYYNINNVKFTKVLKKLGNIQATFYLRDTLMLKVHEEYIHLYKKYETIKEIK